MIDTHCHIDDPQYADHFDTFIQQQKDAGVEAILVPGVNVESCQTVLEVCAKYPDYLYPALGLHPEDVDAHWQEKLYQIYATIQSTPLVAIGEIGLDYHWDTTYKNEQHEAFRTQLRWAKQFNLPVMIHVRDAAEDALRILREEMPLRGVMHCYSGSYEMAREYVKMGLCLGIGGVITFKNCRLADNLCPPDGRDPIPLTSLVLETDAPYMAPVPFRGQPNESRFMEYVVRRLADTYKVTENEVIEVTNKAARALFLKK